MGNAAKEIQDFGKTVTVRDFETGKTVQFIVGEQIEFLEKYGPVEVGERRTVIGGVGSCVRYIDPSTFKEGSCFPFRVKKVADKPKPQPPVIDGVPRFFKGDRVRIVRKEPASVKGSFENVWPSGMDKYVGSSKVLTVREQCRRGVSFDNFGADGYCFPPTSLELVESAPKAPEPASASEAPKKPVQFTKGQRVKIVRRVIPAAGMPRWVGSMDRCVGKLGTVINLDVSGSVRVDVDGEPRLDGGGRGYFYPPEALELVAEKDAAASCLDLAAPLQTRCGYPAEVLREFRHADGHQCLAVLVTKPTGGKLHTFYKDGRYTDKGEHPLDLANPPPPKPRVAPKLVEITPEMAVALNHMCMRVGGHPDETVRGLIQDRPGSFCERLHAAFPGLSRTRSEDFVSRPSPEGVIYFTTASKAEIGDLTLLLKAD